MPHSAQLLATIVAAVVVAFALGLLANRLRLPPLVGYMLAGVAIGPFTPGFVGDTGLARQLAEVGVILLMFGVGLHFSLRDLAAVRRIAVPGALAQIAVAVPASVILTFVWGWPLAAGVLLGLAPCRWPARSCCCACLRTIARSMATRVASPSAG